MRTIQALFLSLLLLQPSVFAAKDVDIVPLKRIVANGQNTVASAGTAEVLVSDTSVRSCCLKALRQNTGDIYVGSSSVDSSNGFELDAKETVCLDVDNTTDIYIDSDTSSEGVSYICTA